MLSVLSMFFGDTGVVGIVGAVGGGVDNTSNFDFRLNQIY